MLSRMGGLTPFAVVVLALMGPVCAAESPGGRPGDATANAQSAFHAPPMPSNPRVALVIGNSAYRNLPPLPKAAADAHDLCAALNGLGFETTCLRDVRTRRAFREAIQRFFSSLSRKYSVVFYYAGHGVQVGSENYLLPTDIDSWSVPEIEEDGISLSYIKRWVEEAGTGPNLMILDACSELLLEGTSTASVRGLARAGPPPDTVLVYSTAPDGVALDEAGKNGLFAKHLLAHMNNPRLSVEQLMATVADGVEREARQLHFSQRPYRSSSVAGSFCLAACVDPDVEDRNLRELLEKTLAERNELKARFDLQQAELVAKRQADDRHELELDALQSQILRRDRDMLNLNLRIQELEGSSGPAEQHGGELEALRSEITSLRRARQEDVDRLEQRNVLHSKEQAQLLAGEAELSELRREIERYRKVVEDLQAKMRRLGSQPPLGRAALPIPSF